MVCVSSLRIYTMQVQTVCLYLNLISCQQQVVNVFGPVLHHSGELPVLAVQVLLPRLHVFLTLMSLAPHDPGPASASHAAPGAPLRGPRPRASPRLGWPEEQEEEKGGEETHDGRKGGLLIIRSTLGACCGMVSGVTGHGEPVTAVCEEKKQRRPWAEHRMLHTFWSSEVHPSSVETRESLSELDRLKVNKSFGKGVSVIQPNSITSTTYTTESWLHARMCWQLKWKHCTCWKS